MFDDFCCKQIFRIKKHEILYLWFNTQITKLDVLGQKSYRKDGNLKEITSDCAKLEKFHAIRSTN